MTNTQAQSQDSMGKIVLIMFMFCLVSWTKINLREGDGNFNHIRHHECKNVQVLHVKVFYILYILQLQGMGSNNIFYKTHTYNRVVHKNMSN